MIYTTVYYSIAAFISFFSSDLNMRREFGLADRGGRASCLALCTSDASLVHSNRLPGRLFASLEPRGYEN